VLFTSTVQAVASALGINTLAILRAKMQECVKDCLAVSNEDLPRVLERMPYKVCESWMVSEPRPDISEKMGYPCFESNILK